MKANTRYYEELARHKDRKKNLSLIGDSLKVPFTPQIRSNTSSSVKNSTMHPYADIHTSPRTKPVRANLRSDMYNKSFSNKESSRDPSSKTMRPPCRQSDNLFDLDDSSKVVRKQIRIVRKQPRPPSRHKTPPKALGLDLPPSNLDFYSVDSTPLSNAAAISNGISFNEAKKTDWKPRADSLRTSSGTGAFTGARTWSAKQSGNGIPVVVNKRRLETSQGTSIDNNPDAGKRSTSRVKQQNQPIFSNLQSEFLDLFA